MNMLVSMNKLINDELYNITLDCLTRNLTVQIENLTTHEVWQNEYSNAFIEDLTEKTGRYMKFTTFCSLLKCAIEQDDSCSYVDILTFSDLEKLRKEKVKDVEREIENISDSAASLLSSKIYLILTYLQEDQKIHYPLALTRGKVQLMKTEMSFLKNQLLVSKSDANCHVDIMELRKEIEKLKQDRSEAQKSHAAYKREVEESSKKKTKEIKKLETLTRTLENDLRLQSKKHNKVLKQKIKENHNLVNQIERMKESERQLKFEVKKLNEQLLSCRRSRPTTLKQRVNSSSRSGSGGSSRKRLDSHSATCSTLLHSRSSSAECRRKMSDAHYERQLRFNDNKNFGNKNFQIDNNFYNRKTFSTKSRTLGITTKGRSKKGADKKSTAIRAQCNKGAVKKYAYNKGAKQKGCKTERRA
ncbi:hypothetical protein HELRODRAFT_165445 [Helobdella robusta]|uniref:Uncharacterized protein n=1 Tax=Helobdella robusta TaxID=6412 RepID=T1EWT2_HELRO|nr:hypothetical protein HELRODRAFT_165445 [Helobdella robusta]ESN91412.1 hypothetical protein HELRODRAFT_165445 [Helobdella robusta]